MTIALRDTPANVIRWLLVALGEGSDPTPWAAGSGNDWPVSAGGEPDTPDSAISVFGTAPRGDGRQMKGDREGKRHHGFQVRVRSEDWRKGGEKAQSIKRTFDETVYDNTVVIDGKSYLVHGVYGAQVTELGREVPSSKRWLFVINATTTIRAIN